MTDLGENVVILADWRDALPPAPLDPNAKLPEKEAARLAEIECQMIAELERQRDG